MPTVVVNSNNTDNKINSLPEAPAVAEAKSGAVAESGAAKVAEAAVSARVETEEKLDCWTPENKDAKKRYNREFLLSLKDKKLSKTFPDALVNFEMAVMDQNVGFVFLRGLREKTEGSQKPIIRRKVILNCRLMITLEFLT